MADDQTYRATQTRPSTMFYRYQQSLVPTQLKCIFGRYAT